MLQACGIAPVKFVRLPHQATFAFKAPYEAGTVPCRPGLLSIISCVNDSKLPHSGGRVPCMLMSFNQIIVMLLSSPLIFTSGLSCWQAAAYGFVLQIIGFPSPIRVQVAPPNALNPACHLAQSASLILTGVVQLLLAATPTAKATHTAILILCAIPYHVSRPVAFGCI